MAPVRQYLALVLLLLALLPVSLAQGQAKPPTWVPTPEERAASPWIRNADEVFIDQGSVSMPLGRILLVRKGPEYCALRFTDSWLGETKADHYTSYEFYYQGDGSGNFALANAQTGTGELFLPRLNMWMGLYYGKKAAKTIQCGGMKLHWLPPAYIGSRDAALAPTPWTAISEVNVHEPRIRWYQEKTHHSTTTLPVDRLWEASRPQ